MNINCIPTGYLVTNTYLVTGNHQPALPYSGHRWPYFSNQYPKAKIYIHPKDDLYVGEKAWHFHGEDFLAIGLLPWVENIEAQGVPFPKD